MIYTESKEIPFLKDKIMFWADQNGLSWELVAGLIWQESKGDPLARRYENGFYNRYLALRNLKFYVPKAIPTLSTERRDRAYSWGLMQLMGQTARENGFAEDSFIKLLEPNVNLRIGCGFLAKLIQKKGNVRAGLLAYNGGGDPDYPNKIFSHIESQAYIKMFSEG